MYKRQVQDELKANGNGEAEFKLHLVTAFLVIEHISIHDSDNEKKEAKKTEGRDKKPKKEAKKTEERGKKPKKEVRKTEERGKKPKKQLLEVVELMRLNPHITYGELMIKLNIKQTALYDRIKKLKSLGLIERVGGKYKGEWAITKSIE